MSKHSNIDPTIGNFYHYYVVVKELFNLKKDEKLVIEIHGDLSKISVSNNIILENFEIKHHKDSNILNYSNVDFWKTIKNWVDNYNSYSKETQLILFTTSDIHKDLENYQNKSKEEKYNLICEWKELTSNVEIKSFFEKIFKNKNKLKDILNKIKFDVKNEKYTNIIDYIIDNNNLYFDNFLDNHQTKIEAVKSFISDIIFTLKDKNKWEIDYEYFKNKKYEFTYKNRINQPIIEEEDLRDIKNEEDIYSIDIKRNPLYIRKLKDIEFSSRKINIEVRQKVRAFKFANKLKDNSFTFYEEKLKKCNITFTEELERIHASYSFKRNFPKNIKNSKKVFEDAMAIDKLCFYDEDKTQSFRKGYWHILADDEDENIYWLIKDK